MPGKIQPAIYQIDLDRVRALTDDITQDSLPVTTQSADNRIIEYQAYQRQQGITQARGYVRRLEDIVFGNFKVTVYSSQGSHPHAWTELFGQTIPDLFVSYPNLVAFISNEDVCYAISAGQGHNLFEQFVDRSFALEVAKRIMNPTVDSTNRREISGAIYGQIQQYRTSQRIASAQTLGTVWTQLGGKVTQEVKSSSAFIDIFDPDNRDISVEEGSSLLIKRSVSVEKLPDLINWIEDLLSTDLSMEQKRNFSFMDGLTQVARRDKSKKELLNRALAAHIFDNLDDLQNIDLDFSHKNFKSYQDSIAYDFGSRRELEDYTWESPPSAIEVLSALVDGLGRASLGSSQDLLEALSTIRFFSRQSAPIPSLSGSVLDYLHGEVAFGSERYFLVDGIWYQASANFLQRLTDDFANAVSSEVFTDSGLVSFDPYSFPNDNENGYNRLYRPKPGWVVMDKVFIERVELADLIYWDGTRLYLIHNKIGYGASARDVCSQVSLSMNVMNTISELPEEQIRDYYRDCIDEYYSGVDAPFSEDEFVSLMLTTPKERIVYVIGYIRKTPVIANSLSSIAKYETVKLISDTSTFKHPLRIVHIQRT